MAGNLVVAAFRDGRRVKGTTLDFLPTRDAFHLHRAEGGIETVAVSDLKALFFVRDLAGDFLRDATNEFPEGKRPPGRRIRVVFADGEEIVGTTQGYDPARKGFFVVPADAAANNERIFVVAASAREVNLL
jgi:hypothetical protein